MRARNLRLRGLTFELTWRQWRDTKPAPQIMHTGTVARALWHAVGSQVERGVRRRRGWQDRFYLVQFSRIRHQYLFGRPLDRTQLSPVQDRRTE